MGRGHEIKFTEAPIVVLRTKKLNLKRKERKQPVVACLFVDNTGLLAENERMLQRVEDEFGRDIDKKVDRFLYPLNKP